MKETVVVIPTYNNAATLERVITEVLKYSLPVIVVNDGSTDATTDILGRFSEIQVISYPKNRGKGYALNQGLKAATTAGYRYALTLDSDGQHYADDIPVFLNAIKKSPTACLSEPVILLPTICRGKIPSPTSFPTSGSNWKQDSNLTTLSPDFASTR